MSEGEFVRTCDNRQRAGDSWDKIKAPMKLVPVVSELYSRLNADADRFFVSMFP